MDGWGLSALLMDFLGGGRRCDDVVREMSDVLYILTPVVFL